MEPETPTVTIGEVVYPIADLDDKVKEMLSLHQQASEMAGAAKRQAVIHDLSVQSLSSLIEQAVLETKE